MFAPLPKPYQFWTTEVEKKLLEKYASLQDLELEERFKLAILIDIYNGNYDSALKDEFLVKLYCKILVAFCHFEGKWLPEPMLRWVPPTVITENEILSNGKKFESLLDCITILLHGKINSAEQAFLKLQQNANEDLSVLWNEYKDKYWEEEKTIIAQCIIPMATSFHTTIYINTQRDIFENEFSKSPPL